MKLVSSSEFRKTLTSSQVNDYVINDKYRYVVVKLTNGEYYCFDTRNETEMEVVQKIITENWCFTNMEDSIVGWKMTKKKPSWVRELVDWQKYEQNIDHLALHKLSSKAATESINKQKYEIDNYSSEEYNYSDVDDNESEKSDSESNSNSSSVESESQSSMSSSINNQNSDDEKDSNDTNDDIKQKINNNTFDNLFSDDFQSKMAEKVKTNYKSSSSDPINIYITGPIRNATTSKSHWVVIIGGGSGGAYMVKAAFLRGYISTVMDGVKGSIIDPKHCDTYYDINLRMEEFGAASKWRRNANDKTTSRISFVYSCDTKEERTGKRGIVEAIELLFKTMEKRERSPIGPMIEDYLEKHAKGLHQYLMNSKKASEQDIGEILTDDINNHFCVGYSIKWDDNLNRCMVDYDIVRILKFYIGYSSWSDVSVNQKKLCYRDFQNDSDLPNWNIQQERYN